MTDVYGAGEAPVPGVSGELVADAIAGACPTLAVLYAPGRAELRGHGGLAAGARATCAAPSGRATSPPSPTSCWPTARW